LKSSKKIFSKLKIKKIDYLFFFSSYVPKNERKSKWGNCRDVNILGLVNFIKQIKIPIKKIILSSSCSVYGENRFKYYNENTTAILLLLHYSKII
jgi:UDP-glucose 4-epimerase